MSPQSLSRLYTAQEYYNQCDFQFAKPTCWREPSWVVSFLERKIDQPENLGVKV